MHSPCVHNAALGLVGRVLKETPVPTPQGIRRLAANIHHFTTAIGHVHPLGRAEFLAKYSGARRQRYTRAADKWPSTEPEGLSAATGFVKLQRINPEEKIDADPRIVNFRRYEQAFALGRFIRPIEDRFLDLAKGNFWIFRGPWLAKKRDLVSRAADIREQFDSIPNCVALSLDVSRYEAHISPELMSLEHAIYRAACRDGEFRRLLKSQSKSQGSMDAGLKYRMKGRRLSGDMNTACGNAILMVLMVGTVMEGLGYDFRIYDDGDDCLLMVPAAVAATVADTVVREFLSFGVTLKVENRASQLEDIKFCQAHPVYWADGRGVLAADPIKQLSQMYSGVKYGRSHVLDTRLAHTTAQGLLSVYAGVPVVGAYHRMVLRATLAAGKRRAVQDRNFEFFEALNGGVHDTHSVDDSMRISYYKAYGVTPTDQRRLEDSFDHTDLYFGPYMSIGKSFDADTWARVDTCGTDTVPLQVGEG